MKRLNIIVITYTNYCYAWQEAIISSLKNSSYTDILYHITHKHLKSKTTNLSLGYRLYKKLDANLFRPSPNALAKINHDVLFEGINSIDSNDPDLHQIISGQTIDIIINLTESRIDANLLNRSKYGVWFMNFCDLDKINKRPYGIWEMLEKRGETVGVLRYLKSGMDFPKTIAKTSSCTDILSFTRNINDILWQTHLLIENNVKLLAHSEDNLFNKLDKHEAVFKNKMIEPEFESPKSLRVFSFALSLYFNKVLGLIKQKLYFNQWALIFHNADENSNIYKLEQYKQILPPKDRFWADPFLINHEEKTYLFIEELIYKNKLGHLSVMEIDEKGNYTKPETIMVKDYHLSYPFIFKDNGVFYMIPETSGNKDIQLYKCVDFPLKWELDKVMMKDVIATDTTIYYDEDTYWMFTSLKKHKGVSKHVELHIFYSDDLHTDEWKPHPMNPVVTDIKTARPAGSIFKRNGKLYRPSQNCSNYYGYGLNIIEIVTLNTLDYEEKLVEAIKPNWDKNVNSTHSFNSANNLYISDIKVKRRRF